MHLAENVVERQEKEGPVFFIRSLMEDDALYGRIDVFVRKHDALRRSRFAILRLVDDFGFSRDVCHSLLIKTDADDVTGQVSIAFSLPG